MNETRTANKIILSFISSTGEKITFTLPRANTALTGTTAAAAMQNLINLGVVLTEKGRPASIESAVLVTTEIESIYKAA